jgi:hypothetical protein
MTTIIEKDSLTKRSMLFRRYHGGTDADHVPVIPGNDFPRDGSLRDESQLQRPAHGNADIMHQTPFGQ